MKPGGGDSAKIAHILDDLKENKHVCIYFILVADINYLYINDHLTIYCNIFFKIQNADISFRRMTFIKLPKKMNQRRSLYVVITYRCRLAYAILETRAT